MMKFSELLITAYDGDKPVFAISIDLDQVATLLTGVDDAGVVEAAELRVTRFDEEQPGSTRTSAAQVLQAVMGLAKELGMGDEVQV